MQKMDHGGQVPECPSEMPSSELAAGRPDAPRRWVIDGSDPEVAGPIMNGYGVSLNEGRQGVFTPNEFRHNPNYVNSDRPTEVEMRPPGATFRGFYKDVLPDKFAGKIPWSDYSRHFDVCLRINQWNDYEAGQFLATRLQGPALKVLNNFPLGRPITYTELVYQLERRFGTGDQSENFLFELRMRRRQSKETLQELGQAIRDLSSLAYPSMDTATRERLAKGHFSDAIDDAEIRAGIFRSHPSTLDEAIQAGLMTEAFMKSERARERMRPRQIRAVDGRPEPEPVDKKMRKELDELKSSFHEMMQMLKGMQMNKKAIVCFNCNEPGHYKSQCPKLQQGNGGRPSQWTEGRSSRQGPVHPLM